MDLNTRGLVNYLLLPVSAIFYLLSVIRKALYLTGLLSTYDFNVPVIVVGNITVGGSGKTPIVIALVEHFKAQGKKVGVVSRGYGGIHKQGSLLVDNSIQASLSGDEPLLIATHSKVPVMVNANRVQALQDLLAQHNVEIVISDDGLQHYAMERSVEIVVIDGERRFGNGFFLPAGPLRESVTRLKSVDFIINNGAHHAHEFSSKLVPKSFVNLSTGITQPLDFFNNKICHGVTGIGYPQRFFNSLSELGISVEQHAFADHYVFKRKDLALEGYPIIMTAKDCVKCKQFATEKMWYLHSEAELSDEFLKKLDEKL